MPRIADSELKRLKDEIAVERLVESSGVELKKAGKDLSGKCPFHEDDTASLVVTPLKNLWHCFGCGIGGGPIDWVIKSKGVSFRHAVELLREGMPFLAADSATVKHSTVRALPAPVVIDADDQALLQQVVAYYHERLKQSPEALQYLMSRGLNHPELIDTFKLGLADRTLGLRLPNKQRKEGAEIRTRLEKLGVYRESGHEHFNGSLVVPILDLHNAVCELYGRKIRDDLRPGTPKHLYLPACASRGRGVFNEAALVASREIILCEALLDALTFWCAGYRNVTSAYGIEGFTDEHLEAFQRHGTERVLIAFDRDEAGERGAAKVTERLLALGIDCYRIEFPKGMDANDYALKVQPANKSLGLLIRKASWLGKGAAPSREAIEPVVQAIEPQPKQNGDSSLIALAAKSDDEAVTLPASVMPPKATDPAATVSEREVVMSFGEGRDVRRWRVRGLPKNLSVGVLKVNVMVSVNRDDDAVTLGAGFHVDSFDLYASRARSVYVQQAVLETGLSEVQLKHDLGRVLLKLETLQDAAIAEALDPARAIDATPTMSDAEREAALNLLKSPDLLARIEADFAACGVVGETVNKRVAYLAAVSRLLERPLAVLIQSSSAAGKSALMDAVLDFVPPEAKSQYSAMTGQSLFYMGETNLKHKVLAIAEEEGASRASYALKLLQSEGELTIASTGSDPKTGNLITQQYRVEGPTMLMMTTTAIDIDEELMNRCLVLTVDENRAQTARIHSQQRARRTLEGLTRREHKKRILATQQNAQRLLKPLAVVNPWADQLTFLDDRTRTRRDHEKYLTLIDVIALLHQYQRPVKTIQLDGHAVDYIEATLADIETANAMAHEVLGRSLDELPPQTRRVLAAIAGPENAGGLVVTLAREKSLRKSDVRFTRAQVRAVTQLSDTQCRQHLDRLAALEYLLVHRGMRGQSYEYELLHDGPMGSTDASTPHLAGLIDVKTLQPLAAAMATTATPTTQSSRSESVENAAPSRGQRVPITGVVRSGQIAASPMNTELSDKLPAADTKTKAGGRAANTPRPRSYPLPSRSAALPAHAAAIAL
jgi:DNA primase